MNGLKKVIRVGFYNDFSTNWIGGINYLKNLLLSIDLYKSKYIKIVLFSPKETNIKELDKIFIKQELILTDLIIKYGDKGFEELAIEYNIDIISHKQIQNPNHNFRLLNWIADFQHLHLKNMFSNNELCSRDKRFINAIKSTDLLLLSSFDAYNDLLTFYPKLIDKARVLNFISYVDFDKLENISLQYIIDKYGVNKYFYIPNQFWKHKNHIIVFKAIEELVKTIPNVQLLCSGKENDYRDPSHINNIKKFILNKKLDKNIKFLGLIPYQDVQALIKYSICVINPSYFEGWSTTVEECKSLGKSMILSDINVHREQSPPNSYYFNPDDKNKLRELMKDLWNKYEDQVNLIKKEELKNTLHEKAIIYAKRFEEIVIEAMKKDKIKNYFYNEEENYLFSKKYNNFYTQILELKEPKYIIYGNGTIGKTIQKLIPKKIIGFVDISDENNHPSNLANMKYDKILITVLGREEEIIKYLTNELSIDKSKIITIEM